MENIGELPNPKYITQTLPFYLSSRTSLWILTVRSPLLATTRLDRALRPFFSRLFPVVLLF